MHFVVLLFAVVLTSCANPAGSSWWVTDFNKYDKNYAPFQTGKIRIGQSKMELQNVLGGDYKVVEAGEGYEIVAYEKWASVLGPDYVDQTLYVRLANDKVQKWKITNDSVVIAPRTW